MLESLFKKQLISTGLFQGLTDWHSHILPGVDDGVQHIDKSLFILRHYEELGIRTLWLTPHIMEDIPNSTERLRQRFAELQAAYDGPVELHLASENMLDSLFLKRLRDNDLLPIGEKGDQLLVETSYYTPPTDLFSLLGEIKRKGYHPLLAHPERYLYMEKKDFIRLREMQVRLQLNLPSLVGLYGRSVQFRAKQLLLHGCYNVCGTDLHRHSMLERIIYGKVARNWVRPLLAIDR